MQYRQYSPPGEDSNFIHPLSKKREMLTLILSFFKILLKKEEGLPGNLLDDYLKRLMNKRDAFMESAKNYGTPQYFYDQPGLIEHIERFNRAFSNNLPRYRAFYAIKSNCFSHVLRDAVKAGMGLDVSSGRELGMALETECEKILFSGPGKTDEELLLALRNPNRIILLLDSFSEFNRLSGLMKKIKPVSDLKVGVRVHGLKKGAWDKFGIPLSDLALLIRKAHNTKGIVPCGVQFHTSWNLDAEIQVSMINDIGAYLIKNLSNDILELLEFMDIGGGFWPEQGEWQNPRNLPIGMIANILGKDLQFKPEHYYHPAKPIEDFAKNIAGTFLAQPGPVRDLELFMEPGRWISNSAMHILLGVIDKKGANTVITDGGINLLGWERPLSEFIPVINVTRFSISERPLRIYGPLCTPDDKWGDSFFGDKVEIGDILLVPDQGAYTYSLRQAFIKPVAKVIKYNGISLEEVERERS